MSTSACRLSNLHLNSSSMVNIADGKTQKEERRTVTKKKHKTPSNYSSTFAKTTSICSYKNTIRKSDFALNNFSSKLKNGCKNPSKKKSKKATFRRY